MYARRTLIKAAAAGALSAPFLSSAALARIEPRPLRLNANENPLGPSPAARAAMEQAEADANRYPLAETEGLKRRIARNLKLRPEHITLGSGSSEVIHKAVLAASREGASIIAPEPTFGVARSYASGHGLAYIEIPIRADFTVDLAAMEAVANSTDGPVIVYLTNPNNPTGTVSPSSQIYGWVERAPADMFFILDEAYHEYSTHPLYRSGVDLVRDGRANVIVTRTFSKIYGLAGLRIGYGIAAPETSEGLRAVSSWDTLNMLGIKAAEASVGDEDYAAQSRRLNAEAKAVLLEGLDRLDLAYAPSETNFVFHRVRPSIDSFIQRMAARGVKVGSRKSRADDWNRVSIGTPDDMALYIEHLEDFRRRGWV